MIDDTTINLLIDYIKLKEEKNVLAREQRYELAAGVRDREKVLINKIYDIILPLIDTSIPSFDDDYNDISHPYALPYAKENAIKKFLLENFDINPDIGGVVKLSRELKLKNLGI